MDSEQQQQPGVARDSTIPQLYGPRHSPVKPEGQFHQDEQSRTEWDRPYRTSERKIDSPLRAEVLVSRSAMRLSQIPNHEHRSLGTR
jgi:hypothetical protein